MGLVVTVVVTGFGAVMGRLYHLHIVESDNLREIAGANRRISQEVQARRGDILDARGNLLATTRSVIHLGMDPTVFDPDTPREQLEQLARLIGVPVAEIEAKAARKSRPVESGYLGEVSAVRWVKLAEIEEPVFDAVRELKIRGVYGNRRFERYYPAGPLGAHVLGYVNKEDTPVTGVERFMDFWLSGQNGWSESEKDGRRREIAALRSREVPATDGYSVQLTLDLVIQNIVEEEIDRIVSEYDPDGVCILVSDPASGAILGMGNYPTYDPNHFWDFPIENQRNRAITDVYEPGSTFKIVPIAGALEEGLINTGSVFDCSVPVVEYKGRKIRLPSDHATLGAIPLPRIVAKSSNRGAALIGMQLGENKLYTYARRFGFGAPTGWGPGGEVSGILHEVKNWDGLTISRLPTGYAVSTTPMQVHYAMATIANRGVSMYPWLVAAVRDRSGEAVVEWEPRVRGRVVSRATASAMANMLVGVVGPEGTARRAAIPGYAVAGKTGTSRKIIDGRYSHSEHVGSFSGFFPAQDPRLVITVVVDNARVNGVAYGGVVAAPAFSSIGRQLAQYLSIQPQSQTSTLVVAN